jgi:hypothetical protein
LRRDFDENKATARPNGGAAEPLSTAPNDPLTNSMVRSRDRLAADGKADERFGVVRRI